MIGQGYRAIKKEVFIKERDKLSIFKGYRFQVGFLHTAVADGYKIAEVPFHAKDRTTGVSKMEGAETIIDTLSYVITARIKELVFGKFGKFLVVGGVGFVLNAIVLQVLVQYADWHPASANLVGAALAIFSNYNLNNLWTFKDEKSRTIFSYAKKLIGFYASSSFGVIFIQTGTIFLGTHFIGEQYYFLYFIFGTGLLLIWNFTMYSKFIWRNKPHEVFKK
jgi:dolichol-phosphate mannosyltransferase